MKEEKNQQILDARNISKKFGNLKAVDNVSLKIYKGEVVALLGPNGAGKTTTIRCLTSLSKPSRNSIIKIDDVNLQKNLQKARRKLGVCAQEVNLYMDSSGIENMELQSYFYGIPKKIAKERIEELFELVKLSDRKNELVKNYSGGMKRRLQIARALLVRPKILFLDEPTLGLSPQSRKDIWNYILKLREQGMSILLTTHYMEEADFLADRILIMDNGKIIAEGTSEELKIRFMGGSHVFIKSKTNNAVSSRLSDEKFEFRLLDNHSIQVKSINGRFPKLLKCLEGIEIDELTLRKPSLEDVFLEITGNSLLMSTNPEINQGVVEL